MICCICQIFKPRASTEAIRSGPGPAGSRGARIVWALNATHLVVTGFDKSVHLKELSRRECVYL